MRNRADDVFQRYIQEICHRYFITWNVEKDRWEVQAWEIPPYFQPSPYKIEKRIREGYPSYLIRRCFVEDSEGHDIGYMPLDMRFIVKNKIGFYNTQQVKKLLAKIDAHNARLEQQIEAEDDYQHRGAAKAMYRYFREPSVDIGGRNGY